MARGWESKSVEEQMENARQKKKDAAAAHTPKPVHHSRQHENLVLARARLVKDLETTDNPRYKQFLEASLADIDKRIAETDYRCLKQNRAAFVACEGLGRISTSF